MNFIKFLQELGIDFALLIAGLSGGLVSLRKDEKLTLWQKVLTVLSGGFIATYLTPIVVPLIEKVVGENNSIEYGVGFVVGYMGLKSIEFVISKFVKMNKDEIN